MAPWQQHASDAKRMRLRVVCHEESGGVAPLIAAAARDRADAIGGVTVRRIGDADNLCSRARRRRSMFHCRGGVRLEEALNAVHENVRSVERADFRLEHCNAPLVLLAVGSRAYRRSTCKIYRADFRMLTPERSLRICVCFLKFACVVAATAAASLDAPLVVWLRHSEATTTRTKQRAREWLAAAAATC